MKKMCTCSCNEKKEEEKNEMNTAKDIEKNKIEQKINENQSKNKIEIDNSSNNGTGILLPNDNDLMNLKNKFNKNNNANNNNKFNNLNSNRNNNKFAHSSNNFSDEINSNMIMNKDDNISNLNENKLIDISNNSNYISNSKKNNNYSNRKNNNSNSNSKQKPKINPKTLKLFQSNSLSISNPYSPNNKENLINNITNLNNIFLNKNNNNNNNNDKWRNLDVNEIISHNKHNSYKDDDIMYKGNIYKLILTYIFRNCNTKNEKFCLLTQKKLFIFNSKENYLLMNKPNHNIDLNNIENCGRIDFSNLNIKSLNKFYFMYIDIKDNEGENEDEKEDLIYRIIKREQKNKFFVLFSDKENIINEWVCTINYFIKNHNENEEN